MSSMPIAWHCYGFGAAVFSAALPGPIEHRDWPALFSNPFG